VLEDLASAFAPLDRVEVDGLLVVEVLPDFVAPEVVVVPAVVLLDVPVVPEPALFPWASWTAELTAWPRLLNPASWAAAFPA
jgi:hypothetical protein